MAKYKTHGRKSGGLPKRIWMLLIGVIVVCVAGVILAHSLYDKGLEPVSNSQQTQIFTVKEGSTAKETADSLEKAKLIRSAWAMELYVHSKELSEKLKAGTYALSPNQGTISVVTTLTRGSVATRLVTILPGQRIDQVRASLINSGFTPGSVDAALQPGQYTDVPVLALKPANVNTLEGLLWPDSFQKDDSSTPETIIRESLLAMGDQLTTDVQAAFAREGLTTYQGVTLASIIIQEVDKPNDQAQAAQVFLARLKTGMVLGSDVTARYGAIAAGKVPNLSYDSPYNTLQHKGLPPTPISTINSSSLAAATHPAATEWLYFVAGDDGVTHFSKTFAEHEALANKYCHKLCGR
jgi:UPF0755 protein